MITTFTFVRHGETDWNRLGIVQGAANVPLNQHGLQQAIEKAPFFADKKYDLAYSSPLIRAYKTMETILSENNYNLTIHTDKRLKERSFGEVEGIHFMYYRSFPARELTPRNYETNEVLEARLLNFLVEKAQEHQGKSLLITAHSHVLKAAHRSIHNPKLNYAAPLANLGVLVLEYDDELKTWSIPYYEGKNEPETKDLK